MRTRVTSVGSFQINFIFVILNDNMKINKILRISWHTLFQCDTKIFLNFRNFVFLDIFDSKRIKIVFMFSLLVNCSFYLYHFSPFLLIISPHFFRSVHVIKMKLCFLQFFFSSPILPSSSFIPFYADVDYSSIYLKLTTTHYSTVDNE